MGKIISGCLFLSLGGLSWAQNQGNAPALTTPTPPPTEVAASPLDGLLTPEGALPSGFTFYGKQVDFQKMIEGDRLELDVTDDIRVVTNLGDTIRADKAHFDFEEDAQSAVTFSGNVRMRTKNGIEIFADRATIDETQESVVFSGNVSAYQGTALHRGDEVTYYYQSRRLITSNLRTSFPPILMESGSFRAIESSHGTYYKGSNAGITTHDAKDPNFWLRGEEITVIPGDKVRFRNLKLYAGDTPIFWLPGLTQSFDGQLNYRPTPGMRSNWGPFLLNEYTQELGGKRDPETGLLSDPTHEATWNLDLYGRRGVGSGVEFDSLRWRENPNLGWLSLYYIHDLDPSERRSAEPRLNFDQADRYRAQLRQRMDANWLPRATGHADVNLTLLSDRFFLEDFYTRDFTTDFNPDNTLSLSQKWDESHLLTAWTRLRLNPHYRSDQRLPEIALDQVRRPVFGSPILHEGQNIVGIYREDLADFVEDQLRTERGIPATSLPRRNEIDNLLQDTGFARFHTYHELSLPLILESGFQLTPRVGAGHTSYRDITGPLDSFARTHLNAAVDASLKFSKAYPDWVADQWGLDSALHVIQPYATASVLQTDDRELGFRSIDRLTASTRPRTLNPGRFAAIDDLNNWQILRLGVRNRILTQRNESSHQWLSVDTYLDVFGDDPEFDRSVSNLYTDVHWSPLPWLDLTVETQLPLFSDSNFTEVSTGLLVMPNSDTEIELQHRFLESHPILQDSNALQLRAYHRINEEWGLGSVHRWEFEDDALEYQQYSLHRNLESWIFTMGVFARDNLERNEYGLMFGFTMTDFPSLSLPFSIDS